MLDANDLNKIIKKAAVEAVEASKPTAVSYGKVISISPLKINVEQKLILSESQLVLTRNVTNYTVQMTVDHEVEYSLDINTNHNHNYSGTTDYADTNTDGHKHSYSGLTGSNEPQNLIHMHAYKGTKQFVVNNSLCLDDDVVLIRMQGGQKYLVLDRVVAL